MVAGLVRVISPARRRRVRVRSFSPSRLGSLKFSLPLAASFQSHLTTRSLVVCSSSCLLVCPCCTVRPTSRVAIVSIRSKILKAAGIPIHSWEFSLLLCPLARGTAGNVQHAHAAALALEHGRGVTGGSPFCPQSATEAIVCASAP